MMRVGEIQTLKVNRISDFGLYLVDDQEQEVLLPNRFVSLGNAVGDEIEVFVYHDSEDRLVATTDRPLIVKGEVACLKVVDKNIHGAFLDWGLVGKDLFLPNRNQQGGVIPGRSYLVWLYVDNITGRCVATQKLKNYIDNDIITIKPRQKVSIVVASESPIGYRAIINNRHWGMIYKNQIFKPVQIGDKLEGFVKRITDDNRIDLMLREEGYKGVTDSADVLLQLIKDKGGVLEIGDKSSPELIHAETQMSKNQFKRAAGVLLKRGVVDVEEFEIRLKK
ncbi:MAG: hypothetical protein E7133_05915 [Rikenellaceae bacterium]|nr:hypothetical protein [Rikenellaceae bacterium]